MKGEDVAAVDGDAFGKQRYRCAGVEAVGNLDACGAGIAGPTALQKNGVVLRGQPPERGPAAYFTFGDEGRWMQRIDCQDIEPRDVIGDQQCAVCDGLAANAQGDAENAEQFPAP